MRICIKPEIIFTIKKYEDALRENDELNKKEETSFAKKMAFAISLSLLVSLLAVYLMYRNSIGMFSPIVIYITILASYIPIAFLLINTERYEVDSRVEYSGLLKNKDVALISLNDIGLIKLIAISDGEVKDYYIDFCNVVEKEDITRAILNFEEAILYIPKSDKAL